MHPPEINTTTLQLRFGSPCPSRRERPLPHLPVCRPHLGEDVISQ